MIKFDSLGPLSSCPMQMMTLKTRLLLFKNYMLKRDFTRHQFTNKRTAAKSRGALLKNKNSSILEKQQATENKIQQIRQLITRRRYASVATRRIFTLI